MQRDELVQQLVAIAAEILGKEVDPLDDFLLLGGTSADAVELASILQERTGAELDLMSLFEEKDFVSVAIRGIEFSGG